MHSNTFGSKIAPSAHLLEEAALINLEAENTACKKQKNMYISSKYNVFFYFALYLYYLHLHFILSLYRYKIISTTKI